MNLLQSLKFVQGAVASTDMNPVLTNFRIKDRKVIGFNGRIAICAPIDLDLDIVPNAKQLTKAISACNDTIVAHQMRNGKLSIQSGNISSVIDCDDPKNYPAIENYGMFYSLENQNLVAGLRSVHPFVSKDDNKPWANGVLLKGQSLYATNSIVMIQGWLGNKFEGEFIIPEPTVKELIRIGEEPVNIQSQKGRLTFHYKNGAWLSTQVYDLEWPKIDTLISEVHVSKTKLWNQAGDEKFFDLMKKIKPFCGDFQKVYFFEDTISSVSKEHSGAAGTQITTLQSWRGIYNINSILQLEGIAEKIWFGSYPKPIPFQGKTCRGAILSILQ